MIGLPVPPAKASDLVPGDDALVDEDVALINSVRIRAIDKTESSQMVYLSNHPREGHRIAQLRETMSDMWYQTRCATCILKTQLLLMGGFAYVKANNDSILVHLGKLYIRWKRIHEIYYTIHHEPSFAFDI